MKMTRIKSVLSIMLALVLLIVLTMSALAYQGKQIFQRMSGTVGETLIAGNVGCVKAADGDIYNTDANDATLRPTVGILVKGGATGASVEIITLVIMTGRHGPDHSQSRISHIQSISSPRHRSWFHMERYDRHVRRKV